MLLWLFFAHSHYAGWPISQLDIRTPSDPIVDTDSSATGHSEITCPGAHPPYASAPTPPFAKSTDVLLGVRNADAFRDAFYAQRKLMPSYEYGTAGPVAQVPIGPSTPVCVPFHLLPFRYALESMLTLPCVCASDGMCKLVLAPTLSSPLVSRQRPE